MRDTDSISIEKGNGRIMVEGDTIKLLRECDAGVKMGVASMEDVIGYIHDDTLKQSLADYKEEHIRLEDQIRTLLHEYHDEGKEPNPMAKGMSWMKTNVRLVMDESDQTIADLMTDGCNMGIKSLHKYLNQYQAADEKSKDMAKQIISLEEKLTKDMQKYL